LNEPARQAKGSMSAIVLITDEPQATTDADGKRSRFHLPGVIAEASEIKAAFGPYGCREAQQDQRWHPPREALTGKQVWFFPGHGDAMLQGDPVLAFEKDGSLETVSIDTLV
jgi:hypothetical protein